ncbi:MAG: hypothetical protein IT355_05210 [Gemmatimonadaceae bacterium]|nr:hypothetical protein [Gemmatimonadaceae bacterium]
MSLPQLVYPWTQEPSAPVAVPAGAGLAVAAASALHDRGYVGTAIAIAAAMGDVTRAEGWRATQAADAALAVALAARAVRDTSVPSVTVDESGVPRFTVRAPDIDTALAALAEEHAGDGVDAELRLFLDEALQSGDRFVDAAPGLGFAALSAASSRAAASVLVLSEHEDERHAIELGARESDLGSLVTVRPPTVLDAVPTSALVSGGTTILHAGGAGDVAPLLRGARRALERGEIGAVAWRCGASGDAGRDAEHLQVAAAVLGVFGFQHFALAEGAGGVELVPAEAMASNAMVFSLSPALLERFGG